MSSKPSIRELIAELGIESTVFPESPRNQRRTSTTSPMGPLRPERSGISPSIKPSASAKVLHLIAGL